MSAALHLAGPDDAQKLLPMVAAFHVETGIESDRDAGVLPLLEGSPLGCIYLIGLRNAPVGYIAVTFSWSIEFGGMDAFIDEFYIRETVRGRGMGTEVLLSLLPRLEDAGVLAIHLEVSVEHPALQRLYTRAGFQLRDGYHLMTRLA